MADEAPLSRVLDMVSQGKSDDEIIEELTKEGYSSNSIFDALSQASLKANLQMPPPPGGSPMMSSAPANTQQIEEIAEAIIDEKWNELLESVNKIVEWKDEIERRIATLEEQAKQLDDKFKTIHTSILSKVSQYDENMNNVGTDVKALTKVFQKVLPGFVENVHELSRIADAFKSSGQLPQSEESGEDKPRKSRMEQIFENAG